MVDYIPMIVSISIVLIVNLGFWLFYRKRHKKDKGFVFAYYHLAIADVLSVTSGQCQSLFSAS
ncbi:hypothetical protein [Halolactibacillus sp. JCM 19043]|uniref:hypothetical protein n=1 Tax=Halolactibacillus sp. JCM 19043 TaxID=1460638 RepID=UPI000784314B|nr:hypothetical protein [Halolactibacillus sp. JCM 19043]